MDRVKRTIRQMTDRELRQAYRSTYTVKDLEQVRHLIAEQLASRGAKLPCVEVFTVTARVG